MTKTRWICDCGEIQDWYRPFCPDCNRSRRNNYNTKEKKHIVPRKPTTKILARLDRYDEILRLRNEEKLKYYLIVDLNTSHVNRSY